MQCAYHPQREPVGACVECGRFICMECKAVLGGKMYCTPCADKKFVQKGPGVITKSAEQQSDNQIIVDRVQQASNYDKSSLEKRERLNTGHIEPPEVKRKQAEDDAVKERKTKAKGYASRMRRGALGLIVGIVITVVTYNIDVIPVTVAAYGFIILGVIWFFTGLFGWLRYKT